MLMLAIALLHGASMGIGPGQARAAEDAASRPQQHLGSTARPRVRMTARQAVASSAVTGLLGVNPDLVQGNWTSIDKPGGMIEQARFVGAGTLRVGAPDPGHGATALLPELVAAGLKLNFVALPYAPPRQNAQWIRDFVARFPHSVAFVEGPNEPNNAGVSYAGETGVQGAVRWQADFYAAMKADPATAGIPVYGMSSWPPVASASDLNNLHVYPNEADQARHYILRDRALQEAVDPSKRWGITELGYFTIPGFEPPAQRQWEGVDEPTQAKLLANAYLDAASLGAAHLSIFSLRDWCSTKPDDIGAHFGLFRCDNRPKPAAIVLRNIAAVLADRGGSVPRGRLTFGTTASAEVRSLLMQRSDGAFILAFWRAPDVWDQEADRPIASQPKAFSLQFGQRQRTVQIFDPFRGSEPILSASDLRQLAVSVPDHPIFVVIASP